MSANYSEYLDLLDTSQRKAFAKYFKTLDKLQAETLRLYRPQPYQDEMHRSRAHVVVTKKSIQTGGTLSHAVEVARAVTGTDPYHKYPKSGVVVIVGYGISHCANTIYPYLFGAGPNSLRIIRDKQTGEWRIFRGWKGLNRGLEGDLDRLDESLPAPPLIPSRYYKASSFDWEKKSGRVFNSVSLKDGEWTILYAPSSGDPNQKQGFHAVLWWIDEDIENTGWYTEGLSRTFTPRQAGYGYVRWDALPHGQNNVLFELAEAAEEQTRLYGSNADPLLISCRMQDNQYLTEEHIESVSRHWRNISEAEYRKRVLGEFSFGNLAVMPSFHPDRHTFDPCELPNGDKKLGVHGVIPESWTRYLFIDPGVQPASLLFVAVPPPDAGYGRTVFVYNELEIYDCAAEKMGRLVKEVAGNDWFYEVVIDLHGSAARDIGSGQAVWKQYRAALELYRVGFGRLRFASDDVQGRIALVNEMLHADPFLAKTTYALRLIRGKTEKTVKQIRQYKFKVMENGAVSTTPDVRGVHFPVLIEYIAAHRPTYQEPPPPEKPDENEWLRKAYEAATGRVWGGGASVINLS